MLKAVFGFSDNNLFTIELLKNLTEKGTCESFFLYNEPIILINDFFHNHVSLAYSFSQIMCNIKFQYVKPDRIILRNLRNNYSFSILVFPLTINWVQGNLSEFII